MKLKEFRERAGLSQSELASRVGVTQGFISHIELGIREPTLKLIRKLAEAVEASVSELVDDNTKDKASGE